MLVHTPRLFVHECVTDSFPFACLAGNGNPKVRPGLNAARALGFSDESISHHIEETTSASASESESALDSLLRKTRELNLEKTKKPSDSFIRSFVVAESSEEEEEATVMAGAGPAESHESLTVVKIEKIISKKHASIDKTVRFYARARKVSLCFLLDTTNSMAPYIKGVKEQIDTILQKVVRFYLFLPIEIIYNLHKIQQFRHSLHIHVLYPTSQ